MTPRRTDPGGSGTGKLTYSSGTASPAGGAGQQGTARPQHGAGQPGAIGAIQLARWGGSGAGHSTPPIPPIPKTISAAPSSCHASHPWHISVLPHCKHHNPSHCPAHPPAQPPTCPLQAPEVLPHRLHRRQVEPLGGKFRCHVVIDCGQQARVALLLLGHCGGEGEGVGTWADGQGTWTGQGWASQAGGEGAGTCMGRCRRMVGREGTGERGRRAANCQLPAVPHRSTKPSTPHTCP